MSALRDQIKREISECKAKCEGNPAKTWGMEYFNNFFCNLPDCFPKGALTHTRTGCQSIMPQHVPLRELGCTNLSDLRLNQSYADFYRAVDDALVTEGIPLEKVVRVQELFFHFVRGYNEGAKWRTHNLLMDIVTPAYMRLREQGYTHYDLAQ